MERSGSMSRARLLLPLLCFWTLSVAGCAPEARRLESVLGSPEHHALNGFKLMDKSRLQDAEREFEWALQLDPEYSPALRGMGLVEGMEGRFGAAFASMERARSSARGEEDKALACVGLLRLHSMQGGAGWLERAENAFSMAQALRSDLPEAYLQMGLAYKKAYRLEDAQRSFQRVLEVEGKLADSAREQIGILQKIETAVPSSAAGKRVAVTDFITRADVADLLVHELGLGAGRPKAREEETAAAARPMPPDVGDHPLGEEIETVIHMEIQGLGPLKDGTFAPNQYVRRSGFAVLITDLIVKLEADPLLHREHLGKRSPFMDVRPEAAYFNAVMVCTEKGLMPETRPGYFEPARRVSGAEAVLVVRNLREYLALP